MLYIIHLKETDGDYIIKEVLDVIEADTYIKEQGLNKTKEFNIIDGVQIN